MKKEEIQKIDEVYVGAILVKGSPGETIYSGTRTLEDGTREARSTVEHSEIALSSLVEFCDAIIEAHCLQGIEASYRLLHFSEDGIRELDPNFYRLSFVWGAKIEKGEKKCVS